MDNGKQEQIKDTSGVTTLNLPIKDCIAETKDIFKTKEAIKAEPRKQNTDVDIPA